MSARAAAAGGMRVVAQVSPGDRAPEGAEEVVCDLGRRDQTLALAADLTTRDEPPRLLVLPSGLEAAGPAERISAQAWARGCEQALTGPFILARALGEPMARAGGAIVSLVPAPGHADALADAAAGGIVGLTRVLAVEWAARGVRVLAIALEPAAAPDAVADLVAFAASPAADFVTGCVLTAGRDVGT